MLLERQDDGFRALRISFIRTILPTTGDYVHL